MIDIAIVGAGKGGDALLRLFHNSGSVRVVGITDMETNAPGLLTAKAQGVAVAGSIRGLALRKPRIVVNVTGDPGIRETILAEFPYPVEVLEGKGARLMWELVEAQRQAAEDLKVLYDTGIAISRADDLEHTLDLILRNAMMLTESSAGGICLVEGDEMALAASRGLAPDSRILKKNRWRPQDGGLTSFILNTNETVDASDMENLLDGTGLPDEIKSMLASPLRTTGDAFGMICVGDREPREFTERHRSLLKLFSLRSAHAIEKARILCRLEESLNSLENIFDDSQDMIIASDTNGVIKRFSSGGERILGYPGREAEGKSLEDFFADKRDWQRIKESLISNGALYNYETVLLRKDGSSADISLTISELRDNGGAVTGTVGVSKDITVEKRLRRELEELNRNLEDKVLERTRELEKANHGLRTANELKGRFIANASHELRTPLHSILGFTEVLTESAEDRLDSKQKNYLATIYASGKHLLHLINNILDLAKIEAGKTHLSYESFLVEVTIEEVASVTQSLAAKKHVTMTIKVDDAAAEFTADKIKFKQILYNLLSNAIKFSPDGGNIGVEAVKFVNEGSLPWAPPAYEFMKVTVTDNGPGIPPEERDRVFDEFEQLDSSKTTEGTGLGLSLTKKLVELHGGQIEAGGTYGQGSEFRVYLPFAGEVGDTVAEHPAITHGAFPVVRDDSPTVLVVEDDHPTVELLTIHLTHAGYRVAHAYDGMEAIEKAQELKPFAITLDIMLPKKDGWEVLQALKECADTKDIPVIIYSIIENKELAFALGATDYLVKPVDRTTLTERLKCLFHENKRKAGPASILLITKDEIIRDQIYNSLRDSGVLLHCAASREDGMDLAMATRPNAMIVDVENPENGFETIKSLTGNKALEETPLFVLADADIPREQRRAMNGHVTKILRKDTFNSGEFVKHLNSLEILYPEKAGLVDEITMLFNHRYLHIRLAQEISRSERYQIPLVFLIIDIDNFSNYVARKGDYYGNMVLRKMAEILKKNIRGSDLLVRSGKSSFSLILTNTTLQSGAILAKRFISMVHDYPFLYEEVQPKGKITISIGAVAFNGHTLEGIMSSAESSLYEAKKKGGNRLEIRE